MFRSARHFEANRVRIPLLIPVLLAACSGGAEIVDGVAAVVGRRAITWSDVRRQLRLEAFFNHQPPPAAPPKRSPATHSGLERLIEQQLLRAEIEQANLPPIEDREIEKRLEDLKVSKTDPAPYGLTRQDLLGQARWQREVDRFVEVRFTAAASISPVQVETYYEKTLAPELKAKGVEPPPLEEVRRKIEDSLREQRANELLEAWLLEQRARVRIQVMDPETP